ADDGAGRRPSRRGSPGRDRRDRLRPLARFVLRSARRPAGKPCHGPAEPDTTFFMSDLELAAADASPSVWTNIRQSLAGSHPGTYTDGPIGRAILLLAVPMVLELALESVFAVVDVFFVSRLGADAVATVGLTESMLTIVYAAMAGLSVGGTATVARGVGGQGVE